jgi:hypothetical protein
MHPDDPAGFEAQRRIARLRALLEEGLASGPGTPDNDADWAELMDIAAGTSLANPHWEPTDKEWEQLLQQAIDNALKGRKR